MYRCVQLPAIVFASFACLAVPSSVDAQCDDVQQVLSEAPEHAGRFGWHVAVDGDTAVVGAFQEDVDGKSNAGRAWVYERQDGTWVPVARLEASNAAIGDQLGFAVAIDGSRIVAGAPGADVAGQTQSGALYVFERPENGWPGIGVATHQVAVVDSQPPRNNSSLGEAVILDGDTIVASAPRHDTPASNAGAFYIFCRDPNLGTWVRTALIEHNGTLGNLLGEGPNSLSLAGEVLAIGASLGNLDGTTGYTRIYVRDTKGTPEVCDDTWSERQLLVAPESGVRFGAAVAVAPEWIAVGAWQSEAGEGRVYVYPRDRAGTPADPSDDVWLDGAPIVIMPEPGFSGLGASIAADPLGTRMVVGAIRTDGNRGSAHFYSVGATVTWTGDFVAEGLNAEASLGQSVALSGNTVIISAPRFKVSSSEVGTAYILDCPPPNTPPIAICSADEIILPANDDCEALVTSELLDLVDGGSYDPDGNEITRELDLEGTLGLGEHAVTLTITDEHGAQASCQAIVNVVDQTPPVITCPAPIVVTCADAGGAAVEFDVPVSDSCSEVAVTCWTIADPPVEVYSGTVFPVGDTIVSCVAADSAGNASVCEFTITVEANDPTIETISAPATVSVCENVPFAVTVDGSASTIQWNFGDGTVLDPLPIETGQNVTHSYSHDGVYLAKATVFSSCGGSVTATIAIVVEDVGLEIAAGAAVFKAGSKKRIGHLVLALLRHPFTHQVDGLFTISHPDLGNFTSLCINWLVMTSGGDIVFSATGMIGWSGPYTALFVGSKGGSGTPFSVTIWSGVVDPFDDPGPPVYVLDTTIFAGVIAGEEL